jgi:hypothetical protein
VYALLKREMSHISMSMSVNEPTAAAHSTDDTDKEFFSFAGIRSAQNNSVMQEMELYLSDECK